MLNEVKSKLKKLESKLKKIKPEYLKGLVFFLTGLVMLTMTVYIYRTGIFTRTILFLFIPYIIGFAYVFCGIYIAYKKWARA
ncbi:hypothetical protein KAI56_00605 [Candidatus Parcubacteria bacterium]|nr:hypothetical protein [Candidatus Parcubacteria bacterium]